VNKYSLPLVNISRIDKMQILYKNIFNKFLKILIFISFSYVSFIYHYSFMYTRWYRFIYFQQFKNKSVRTILIVLIENGPISEMNENFQE